MQFKTQHLVCLIAACWLTCAANRLNAAEDSTAEFFSKEVLPILEGKCFKCHGGEETEGSLQLTSREFILEGGDNGAAVDLESPEESLLVSAVNYEDLEMPPTGKLPQAQIDVLTRWIKMGMPYPEGLVKIDASERHGSPQVNEENRKFWSFQPIDRPDVPETGDGTWVKSPLDQFVLRRLEAAGLEPNPPAAPGELVRRIYYDLIGLPPSPREAEQWTRRIAGDASAVEELVDQLLASPHYGERWGRHWLDLVRYAETNSYERDAAKPRGVAVSRLRDPGFQRRQAVRSIHSGTTCRRTNWINRHPTPSSQPATTGWVAGTTSRSTRSWRGTTTWTTC